MTSSPTSVKSRSLVPGPSQSNRRAVLPSPAGDRAAPQDHTRVRRDRVADDVDELLQPLLASLETRAGRRWRASPVRSARSRAPWPVRLPPAPAMIRSAPALPRQSSCVAGMQPAGQTIWTGSVASFQLPVASCQLRPVASCLETGNWELETRNLFHTRDQPALTPGSRFEHIERRGQMGAGTGLGQQPLVMTPGARVDVGGAAQPHAKRPEQRRRFVLCERTRRQANEPSGLCLVRDVAASARIGHPAPRPPEQPPPHRPGPWRQ